MSNKKEEQIAPKDTPDAQVVANLVLGRAATAVPVSLDSILSLWTGVRVSRDDLDKPGYLVDLGKLGAEIVIRERDTRERQRFTIAHELGHWLLAREFGIAADATHGAAWERWCDRFATALLMPERELKAHLVARTILVLLEKILVGPERFCVSAEAFRMRVTELTEITLIEARWNGQAVQMLRTYENCRRPVLAAELLSGLSPSIREVPFAGVDRSQKCLYGGNAFRTSGSVREVLICAMPATGAESDIASVPYQDHSRRGGTSTRTRYRRY